MTRTHSIVTTNTLSTTCKYISCDRMSTKRKLTTAFQLHPIFPESLHFCDFIVIMRELISLK